MSAVTMLRHEGAIWIFADTAFYAEDGIFKGEVQKTTLHLPQRCAVTCRGPLRASSVYRNNAAHRVDFDDVLAHMAEDLRDAAKWAVHFDEPIGLAVALAGWSEAAGDFVLGEMGVFGESLDDLTPESLTFRNFDPVFSVPHVSPLRLAESRLLDEEGRLDVADLTGTVVKLMNLARAHNYRVTARGRTNHCIVGGSVQMTRLAGHGELALSAIIHRWPDEVGAPMGREISDREDFFYEGEAPVGSGLT